MGAKDYYLKTLTKLCSQHIQLLQQSAIQLDTTLIQLRVLVLLIVVGITTNPGEVTIESLVVAPLTPEGLLATPRLNVYLRSSKRPR